jgi:outer membrane protein OmpA-like peptidoglycan-associated protein
MESSKSLKRLKFLATLLCAAFAAAGCAPITEDTNPPPGSPVAMFAGGAAGVGATAVLNAPPPVIATAGVAGATLGYYLSSLRFASGGVIKLGGQVYTIGDYVIIDIPTDNMFDTNTTEFLPGADLALDGVTAVLKRYPHHNIIISGNTSGFGSHAYEKRLSQERAGMVASYLWDHGITDAGLKPFENAKNNSARRLIYVGYGNNYPIANDLRLRGIRANSRMQIVAFPSDEELHWDKSRRQHYKLFKNMGCSVADKTPLPPTAPPAPAHPYPDAPIATDRVLTSPAQEQVESQPVPPTENTGLSESLNEEFSDGSSMPTTSRSIVSSTPTYNNPTNNTYASNDNDSSSDVNAPQTLLGSSVKKHWGFKGDNELQDETPGNPPVLPG